jgi:hypothetical protein
MDARTIKSVPLTDADIVRHYQTGTLLSELLKPNDTGQQKELHAQIAALHNAGDIDLLALTATTEFQNLGRRYFFAIQQAYGNAMPLLAASASAMLEIVRRMETQAGSIAPSPRIALRKWIGAAPERAKEMVRLAQPDPGFDREILMEALIAQGDANSALSFLVDADPRRQAALAALGSINPKNLMNNTKFEEALKLFKQPNPVATLTGYEREQRASRANYERLKAERLAREVEHQQRTHYRSQG